jgi:hypothetical protein
MSDDQLPDTLFRADLAKFLRMSLRTLDELRARRANLPAEMTRLDDRPRWNKQVVLAWAAQSDATTRFKVARGERR